MTDDVLTLAATTAAAAGAAMLLDGRSARRPGDPAKVRKGFDAGRAKLAALPCGVTRVVGDIQSDAAGVGTDYVRELAIWRQSFVEKYKRYAGVDTLVPAAPVRCTKAALRSWLDAYAAARAKDPANWSPVSGAGGGLAGLFGAGDLSLTALGKAVAHCERLLAAPENLSSLDTFTWTVDAWTALKVLSIRLDERGLRPDRAVGEGLVSDVETVTADAASEARDLAFDLGQFVGDLAANFALSKAGAVIIVGGLTWWVLR